MTLQIKPVSGGAAVDATADNIAALRSALGVEDVAGNAAFIALRDSTEASLGALQAGLDGKSPVLTFGSGLTRVGNTVSAVPTTLQSAGSPLDGQSYLVLPSSSSFGAVGAFVNTSGTYAGVAAGASTNLWNSGQRGRLTAAAGTGNLARLYVVPGMRFANDNSNLMGFKHIWTYASNDALTTAHVFVGVNQHANLPATGVNPSAYTGQRFGLQCAGDDANRWFKLVFYNGTTLTVIKDLGSAFGCDGLETNPIQFEVESIPSATGVRVIKWKVTHMISKVSDEGTLTGTGPQGNFETNFSMWRDSNGSATQATFTSKGLACGALQTMVVGSVVSGGDGGGGGGNVTDNSVPREVVASGPLLATDVGCVIRTNSASAVQLTLPSPETLGITPGKASISVYVKGAGVTTIVPQNGVTAPGGTAPSGVQGTFVNLVHNGENWVYPA